jgi:hypothetical protein
VAAWLYSLFIQEHLELLNPVPIIATVAMYAKDSSPETIHIELSNVPECDEAIIETPVTSVPLPRAKIANYN